MNPLITSFGWACKKLGVISRTVLKKILAAFRIGIFIMSVAFMMFGSNDKRFSGNIALFSIGLIGEVDGGFNLIPD